MNEISFGNENPGPQVGINYGEINISPSTFQSFFPNRFKLTKSHLFGPDQQVNLQERIDDGSQHPVSAKESIINYSDSGA